MAPLLPAGTRPDTFDGLTYVGLIGFQMVGVGLGRGPGVPYFGTFWETNVRLYSVDDARPAGRGVPLARRVPAGAGAGRPVEPAPAVQVVGDAAGPLR